MEDECHIICISLILVIGIKHVFGMHNIDNDQEHTRLIRNVSLALSMLSHSATERKSSNFYMSSYITILVFECATIILPVCPREFMSHFLRICIVVVG